MIIQEQGDQLILIRQTDHAMLSGFFARALGNKVFSRPEPFESFCLGATEHDNGWNEWELLPQIDPRTFAPYNFMSIPTEEHVALYQRGIERIVRVDHYAGLLVSMHCAGLYDRTRATMPGFSAKYVKSNESHIVTDFLQRLRLQQLRLKVDLRADPLMKFYSEDHALQANLQFAESLGAKAVRLKGKSVADAAAQFVREKHVTQMIFGRSAVEGLGKFLYLNAINRFLREAPAVDVHIVTQESD